VCAERILKPRQKMNRLGIPLSNTLEAPFPYFGGKSKVAAEVWRRFGDVRSYVEPFFGSGAVLLGRPRPFHGVETVNDKDALLCNFWRAVQANPAAVAHHADWPVNECDLHARHLWLVEHKEDITDRLILDPEWFDAKAAGWWVWGICAWIGTGWCTGNGSWGRDENHFKKVGSKQGINRQIPHLSSMQGINRLNGGSGKGILRPDVMDEGTLKHYFSDLALRLRDVRVCTGDWSRVVGDSVTFGMGVCAVFLDPPYDTGTMDYGSGGMGNGIAAQVRDWAVKLGARSDMHIALCGYDEHDSLLREGWVPYRWKAGGGYGNQNKKGYENASKEVIWFSPHCIKPEDSVFDLFGES
jgi:DNA adenine methylase